MTSPGRHPTPLLLAWSVLAFAAVAAFAGITAVERLGIGSSAWFPVYAGFPVFGALQLVAAVVYAATAALQRRWLAAALVVTPAAGIFVAVVRWVRDLAGALGP